jgi:hypothetical protein
MGPSPGHSGWKRFSSTTNPLPVAPGNEGITMPMLTGSQAVPLADPHCDQNGKEDEWHQHHFIHLIIEDLKKAKIKPLNYSQVIVVQQGPDENLLTFLQHLKDAIRKHTIVDPE